MPPKFKLQEGNTGNRANNEAAAAALALRSRTLQRESLQTPDKDQLKRYNKNSLENLKKANIKPTNAPVQHCTGECRKRRGEDAALDWKVV